MKVILLVFMLLVSSVFVSAQDDADFGTWNDVQVSHAVTKQVDVIGGVRFNTRKNSTVFAEQRLSGGINWKSKDGRFTVQPWLVFLKNFSRTPYYELRPQVTLGYKFTASKINVTPKVRLEYHSRHQNKDAGRVVPIVTIDRKLTKNYGVFQTTEVWIPVRNDRDVAKYRQRYFFGVTRTVNKKLAIDVFYLYQREEQTHPQHGHTVGLTWKIKV